MQLLLLKWVIQIHATWAALLCLILPERVHRVCKALGPHLTLGSPRVHAPPHHHLSVMLCNPHRIIRQIIMDTFIAGCVKIHGQTPTVKRWTRRTSPLIKHHHLIYLIWCPVLARLLLTADILLCFLSQLLLVDWNLFDRCSCGPLQIVTGDYGIFACGHEVCTSFLHNHIWLIIATTGIIVRWLVLLRDNTATTDCDVFLMSVVHIALRSGRHLWLDDLLFGETCSGPCIFYRAFRILLLSLKQ